MKRHFVMILFFIFISYLISVCISSFYLLLMLYAIIVLLIPFYLIKSGKNGNIFIEGGFYSIIVPVLTIDHLFKLLIGISKGNTANIDFLLFETIPAGILKIKLFIIIVFLIGGTICSVSQDLFQKREIKEDKTDYN